MKVGAQFLIAVRLLSTVKNLSAHLTLTGRGAQLNLYCLEKKVIYLDTSSQFPQSWFQGRGETAIAGELAPTASFEQKIQTIRKIEAKPDLLTAFREASRGILTTFFQGPVLECRLKQITPVASFALLTLPDIFFDYAHPFVKNISPEELLPTKEIPFKQSANFLEHSASIKMGAQEGYLVSRLEQLLTVREIVSSVPGDEADTKRNLLMFWAFGVLDSPVLNQLLPKVDAAKEIPKETPASAASDHGTAAQGESIEELVAGVNLAYQNLSKKDFYSLLGVTARGDLDEVKAAYYKLARKFHPDRFYGLHDPVLKEKVDVIFSAINVAYETLKNNKRRLEYDNAPKETKVIGKTTLNSENTSTVLTKETKNRIAEEHFKKAQKSYEEGNYYQAVQFLRSATQIEPGVAKFWRQLGISLSRNPQWRKEAEDSFQKAMDLEPKNPENHLYLGFLYKNAGMKLRAKKHFQTCREMDPHNEIAIRELAAIDGVEVGGDKDQSTTKKLLGNIFKKK